MNNSLGLVILATNERITILLLYLRVVVLSDLPSKLRLDNDWLIFLHPFRCLGKLQVRACLVFDRSPYHTFRFFKLLLLLITKLFSIWLFHV